MLAQLGALKKIHVLRQLSLLCDLAGFTISELVLGLLDTNLKDSLQFVRPLALTSPTD